MKVLVSGGTGYIGSHTVVELQQNAYDVVIADNFSNSFPWVADQIGKITGKVPVLVKTDLCIPAQTESLFNAHPDIEGVIHFAALKAVGESMIQPLKYYSNNLISLINLLNIMQKRSISNFVFSSSCTVYGMPDVLPVNEEAPVKTALSPYGNTKQISEEIIKDAISEWGLNAVSLRYFNPIGAHTSALIGELPLGVPNNLVPFITQTAIGKRNELNVFGSDYDTPDGTCIRDYIHVSDLAKAHVAALARMGNMKNKKAFEVFNLGTGKGYSVLEVINAFERISKTKLRYTIRERRPGDVDKVWADATLAERELSWKADTGLDQMLLSAWKWEQFLSTNPLTNK